MVAAALPCDDQDVPVRRLAEALVRPYGDRVVPVEVAEDPPARLPGAVEPLALAAPGERVALPAVPLERGGCPRSALS